MSIKSIRGLFENYPGIVTEIAGKLGVTKGHVSRVLSGERQSPSVEAACRAEAEQILRMERRK